MTDIATITRNAHDTGFEQGSVAACNVILAFLHRSGHGSVAAQIRAASEDGSIMELQEEEPKPADRPTMDRKVARVQGYTGDMCTACNGLRVKRNGSCVVCEDCGQTTGCS